jgi:hypothetical protein
MTAINIGFAPVSSPFRRHHAIRRHISGLFLGEADLYHVAFGFEK